MITSDYNPSPLEVLMANILAEMKDEIGLRFSGHSIINAESDVDADNPTVVFHLEDHEGDRHQLVIKIIQKPDERSSGS